MDIVFKASSLNYDQGSGNYQELKKITRWNGKQYTLVSRYALRYSILETLMGISKFKIADGEKMQLAGDRDNKVIQPAPELLLSGEILKYPEFDLFGYLITSTDPQNFRTSPVKLSHAISMTPFSYDALFNANLGMANRLRKIYGDMKPNPFTSEEHETFYIYSITIDLDKIGKLDLYLKKGGTLKRGHDGKEKWKIESIEKDGDKIKIKLKEEKKNGREEIIETHASIKVLDLNDKDIYHVVYSTDDAYEKIETLIKSILNLHRPIKGRDENLSPKLIVLGLYDNAPYKTFKDRISLVDEITEESIDEITETPTKNGKIVKVVHKTVKSTKPKFRIYGLSGETEHIDEQKIFEKVEKFLKNKNEKEEIHVFKLPEIEVELQEDNTKTPSDVNA